MHSLYSIKFLVSEKNHFIHFPISSYIKTLFCKRGHLGIPIDKKNTFFYQFTIPSCKRFPRKKNLKCEKLMDADNDGRCKVTNLT
jgi:hypothetical protein